ncbi:MAG: exodeoxyribonuclease VII large subunit [Clostridia bacterium]|nr:exodeoxyribonuclease VII large subunit [Clostridia bacterium]
MEEITKIRVYGVSEITWYVREYLAEDALLASLAVQGEISGFRAHSSGHIYFTLKEKDSALKTVMFRRYAGDLAWQPGDGDHVVVIGSVSLYERDGTCQLYAEEIIPAGDGAQARALNELKERLAAEGLFDAQRKQPLPQFAVDIGVITSAEGAAWADIRRVAAARNPKARLTLYPVAVQGERAPAELAKACAAADSGGHEVLIIGRGGGAEEDLAAFNHELVVRAVANLRTAVIAAVGHESDFTLCDLAADWRAATPSHAAAAAVADRFEIEERLSDIEAALRGALGRDLKRRRQMLVALDVEPAARRGLERRQQRLDVAIARLEALSPLGSLRRGYCLVERSDGSVLRRAADVRPGERLKIYAAEGQIFAMAEGMEDDKSQA